MAAMRLCGMTEVSPSKSLWHPMGGSDLATDDDARQCASTPQPTEETHCRHSHIEEEHDDKSR